MLTWPQNAGNPISEGLNFKNFLGQDASQTPYRGPWSVSQIPFSKILYQPQYIIIYSPLLRESSKKARFSAKEPCGINVKQL